MNAVLAKPEIAADLDAIKAEAQGNLMIFMTKVVPKTIEVLGERLTAYGFAANQMGIMQFIGAMNVHAQGDPEVKAQLDAIKAQVMHVPRFCVVYSV
jgi:hypothetical protein